MCTPSLKFSTGVEQTHQEIEEGHSEVLSRTETTGEWGPACFALPSA